MASSGEVVFSTGDILFKRDASFASLKATQGTTPNVKVTDIECDQPLLSSLCTIGLSQFIGLSAGTKFLVKNEIDMPHNAQSLTFDSVEATLPTTCNLFSLTALSATLLVSGPVVLNALILGTASSSPNVKGSGSGASVCVCFCT